MKWWKINACNSVSLYVYSMLVCVCVYKYMCMYIHNVCIIIWDDFGIKIRIRQIHSADLYNMKFLATMQCDNFLVFLIYICKAIIRDWNCDDWGGDLQQRNILTMLAWFSCFCFVSFQLTVCLYPSCCFCFALITQHMTKVLWNQFRSVWGHSGITHIIHDIQKIVNAQLCCKYI